MTDDDNGDDDDDDGQRHTFNLSYYDCCADTYYPDHFGSLLPLFHHITS